MISGKDTQRLVTASAAASGPLPVDGSRWQLGLEVSGVAVVQSSAALASFTIQGRISPDAPWVDLHSPNASLSGGAGSALQGISRVMPEMRLQWSGNAGTVSAWVMA